MGCERNDTTVANMYNYYYRTNYERAMLYKHDALYFEQVFFPTILAIVIIGMCCSQRSSESSPLKGHDGCALLMAMSVFHEANRN